MRSKELRVARAKLIEDARALLAGDSVSNEARAKFDEMIAASDVMKADIDRIEASERLAAELAVHTQATADARGTSRDEAAEPKARDKRIMTAYLRGNMKALAPEDREHFTKRFNNTAMNTGTNSAGGYTIAPEFAAELLVAMKAQGGVRAVARNIQTDTGANLPWPTMDDTAQVATIIGENTAITEDTELAFGQTSIGGYTYKSGVILISLQLLQDSAFSFDSIIRDAVAGRFVRGQNAHFTTGSGAGQPQGVLTGAASGTTGATGSTLKVGFNDLIALEHSVDPVYRRGASWMMHDSSVKVLKGIVDSQNRPLFLPGYTVNAPDSVLGYPIVVNQDMPVMAANAKSILFGNFSSYIIRDVLDIQMMVLRERYAEYLQVGYIAYCRTDAKLITAAQPLKYYANSAT